MEVLNGGSWQQETWQKSRSYSSVRVSILPASEKQVFWGMQGAEFLQICSTAVTEAEDMFDAGFKSIPSALNSQGRTTPYQSLKY